MIFKKRDNAQLFKKAGIVSFSTLPGSIFLAPLHLAWAEKPSNVSDVKDKAMAIALSEGRDGSATKFRKKEEMIICQHRQYHCRKITRAFGRNVYGVRNHSAVL